MNIIYLILTLLFSHDYNLSLMKDANSNFRVYVTYKLPHEGAKRHETVWLDLKSGESTEIVNYVTTYENVPKFIAVVVYKIIKDECDKIEIESLKQQS